MKNYDDDPFEDPFGEETPNGDRLDGKTVVMLMEYKWTYLYLVPTVLYDEIIERYGRLQSLYDACSGRNVDPNAENYLTLITNCQALESDGFVAY